MSFRFKKSLARLKSSWTFWFNMGSALLAAAELQFQLLQPYLGEKWYGLSYFVLAMVNVALRVKTELSHQKALASQGQQ